MSFHKKRANTLATLFISLFVLGPVANFIVGSPGTKPLSAVNGGFNRDGKPRLATANHKSGASTVSRPLNTSRQPTLNPAPSPSPFPSPRPTPPPPGPNGQIVFASFVPNEQYEIFVMNADGSYPTRVTYNAYQSTDVIPPESDYPAWSPDNSKIAFRMASSEQDISGIYTIDIDGNNQRRLTTGLAEHPTWSPDGNRIAFASSDIYIVNADGSNLVQITDETGQDYSTAWSPDGNKIAFVRYVSQTTFDICTVNPDGSNFHNLTNTPAHEAEPAWSPDSSKIAYIIGNEIYLMNADGSNQGPLPTRAFGRQPTWSPDGTKIVFTVGGGDSGELYVMNADGSDQRPITNAPPSTIKGDGASTIENGIALDGSRRPNWQRNLGPQLSVDDIEVTEGNNGTTVATFTVELLAVSNKVITVDYATANSTASAASDYLAASGTLTFNPGDLSHTVTVTVNGDMTVEPNEQFFINLTNPTNTALADAQGVCTITNDDFAGTLQFSAAAQSAQENAGSTTITVTRTGGSLGTVTVAYTTIPVTATSGADYTPAGGTLSFAPGVLSQTFPVTIKNDVLDEANETITLKLSNPTGGATLGTQSTATLSITDDDSTPSLSVGDFTATEGDTSAVNANFTLKLSAASGQTVTVKYRTANGTATSPADYGAVPLTTLTFLPGQISKTVSVQVKGDLLDEPSETFKLLLSSPTNATLAISTGTGTIRDNDLPPSLKVTNITLAEANTSKPANFAVSLSAPSGQTVTVQYATLNGTATAPADYTAKPLTTLTFLPGQISKTVTVAVAGDLLDEATESFKLQLYYPTNATIAAGTGTCTITDNDPPPSFTITNATVTEPDSGAINATFTINLSSLSGQSVTVKYATGGGMAGSTATAGSDYTAAALTTLTFLPGQTTKTVTVPVTGDLLVELNETFFVNLSGAINATIADAQGLGTINNDD